MVETKKKGQFRIIFKDLQVDPAKHKTLTIYDSTLSFDDLTSKIKDFISNI